MLERVIKIASNFDQAKHFILPDREKIIHEQRHERDYFTQQMFNEVRRSTMLDYMTGREFFLEMGEQWVNHTKELTSEWQKFIQFYHDANNQRKVSDEEFVRKQFIGEELDWKMLAENMELFKSDLNDIRDLQGFDPNISLALDQSIIRFEPSEKTESGIDDNGQ